MSAEQFVLEEKLVPYYQELDPAKRRSLLDEIDGEQPSFRRELYKARYEIRHKPERIADHWLFKCVYLPGLYRRKFLKKSTRREVNIMMNEMFLERELTDAEKCNLYHEMRNTVRRYLGTCRSPRYASSFFGFKKASDEEKLERASEEIWKMSLGLARLFSLEEKMQLWCDACLDELREFNSGAESIFKDFDERYLASVKKK